MIPLLFPGPDPGIATARLEEGRLTLENAAISVSWDLTAGRFKTIAITDRIANHGSWPQAGEIFVLTLADGSALPASKFRATARPRMDKIAPAPDSVRAGERFGGWRAALDLESEDGRVRAQWRGILRDGSNYARQEVEIRAADKGLPLREAALLGIHAPNARAAGTVDGSPVVAGGVFFACEHPMAKCRIDGDFTACSVPRHRPLRAGESWTLSSVIGVAPEGQLRRAFLHYLERERARPYAPFSYYISWFDIAAPDRKMDAKQCLEVIEAFGGEMVAKRGVKLSAFVFDDGWDDNGTLWRFHAGFPEGFRPLRDAAARHGARLGTWISPFGGYGVAKKERLALAAAQGFETNRVGFSLAGASYYNRFRDVCAGMVREQGIRYLKFDGIGGGSNASGPGPEFGADLEALLRLIEELRGIQPDLFFNTTVGTWPSPFWLRWSDSTWRGGADVGYLGGGTTRNQWMTYRDSFGYKIRTERGPLYPLNSLKFQSVMFARLDLAAKLSNEPGDLIADIRMAAGSGTQMQEFFITPAMMSPAAWDAMAEAVDFGQRNAALLADTHGIGGDPARGEPYGYASWSPRGAVLALRNPGAQPARFAIDPREAFELPPGAPQRYTLRCPWKESSGKPVVEVEAGRPHAFDLAPFEVQIWEAGPR